MNKVFVACAALAFVAAVPSAARQSSDVAPMVRAMLDKAQALDADGKTGDATVLIERAVALAARTAPNSESHATALALLAEFKAGFDAKQSLALAQQSAAIRTKLYGPRDIRTLREQHVVAVLLGLNGDNVTGLALLGSVLSDMGTVAKDDSEREEAALARSSYAMKLYQTGDNQRAMAEVEKTAAVFDGPPASMSEAASNAYSTLAALELIGGQYERSAIHATRAIEIGKKAKGPNSPDLIPIMRYRAEALLRLGQFGAAETQYREALTITDRTDPPIPSIKFGLMKSLGRYYLITGQLDVAVKLFDQAVALTDTLEKDSSLRVTAQTDRADALLRAGRLAEAESAMRSALQTARAIEPGKINHVGAAFSLSELLLDLDRADEAAPLLAEGTALIDKIYADGAWERGRANTIAGDLAMARDDLKSATAYYALAIQLLEAGPLDNADRINAAYRGGRAFARAGDTIKGWALSRNAADRLTRKITSRGEVASAPAMLSRGERAVFDAGLDVAWMRSKDR